MKNLLNEPAYKYVKDYFESIDFTSKSAYANWLAQTSYFVSHSVRLSSLGAAYSNVDDPTGKRMSHHTIEEKGHHTIAQMDIKKLGFHVTDFPELGVTKAFYQSQYYRVAFERPSHLFGQIFMLEALASQVGESLHKSLVSSFGPEPCQFVKIHAFEDVNHVKKALEAMEALSSEEKTGVKDNFLQACEMYFQILRSIKEQSFIQSLPRPTPGIQAA